MNKKMIMVGLASVLAVSTLSAKVGDELSKDKLMELKRSSKLLQNPALKVKKGMDKDSVYFLQLEAKGPRGSRTLNAFVDKKTGAVYFGGGFDKDGKQMVFPVDAQVVKDGVSFTVGDGKKEIYVVTDPECPFCQKFEKAAEGKLDDYKIHFIFMPLSFHKEAPAMTQWIMEGKTDSEKKERMRKVMVEKNQDFKNTDSYKKYKEKMNKAQKLIAEMRQAQQAKDSAKVKEIQGKLMGLGNGYEYSKEVSDKIMKANKAAQELGAKGTPAVFDANFKPISWPSLVSGDKPAPTPTKAPIK